MLCQDESFKSLGGASIGVEVPHLQKSLDTRTIEDDPGPEAITRAPLTPTTTVTNEPLITPSEHDPGPHSLVRAHDTQSTFDRDSGPNSGITLTRSTMLDHDPDPRSMIYTPVTQPILCNHDPGPSKLSNILTIDGSDEITTNQHYRVSDIKDSMSSFMDLHDASLVMPIEGIG